MTPRQTPDHTQTDAMSRYAPERAARRAAHAPHARSAQPDLLPWDLGLDWSQGDAALGEECAALQYLRLDTRYTITPTRAEAFTLMALMGLNVIEHATVEASPEEWDTVIVYTSAYGGHVGQDKRRLTRAEALAAWPGALCSRYRAPDVPPGAPPGTVGVSRRDLVCGDHVLHVTITSGDWRSNVACTDIRWSPTTMRPEDGPYGVENDALAGPLFAIDFITSGGVEYAVDFNTCPGATDGPTDLLPGGSVTGAVSHWRGWRALRGREIP